MMTRAVCEVITYGEKETKELWLRLVFGLRGGRIGRAVHHHT